MKFLKNKLAVTILVLSVLILLIIGITATRTSKTPVENIAGRGLNSAQKFVYKISDRFKNLAHSVLKFSDISKENEDLKKRNSELEEKALKYDELDSENKRLRDILDFTKRNEQYNYVTCNIINKYGSGYIEGYTIDKGSKAGLQKGMVVITHEGLVGQVTTVSADWSIVETILNKNIAVAGEVYGKSQDVGVVKGEKDKVFGNVGKISGLSLKAEIQNDDIIVTSGTGEIYPGGVRIGKVLKVDEDKGNVMKTALIKPAVDFYSINELIIVVPKDTSYLKYNGENIK